MWKINENGESLLSFYALNELVIMNTTFGKKNIHKYTWQHPGSKKWHVLITSSTQMLLFVLSELLH